MRYVFKLKGVPKPRMTRGDKWKERKVVTDYWAYKDQLQILAKRANFKLPGNLSVEFYIQMPKSWSKKKKGEMLAAPHTQRPDLDNLIKGFKDALEDEDCYVHTYTRCGKYWWFEDLIVITEYSDRSNLERLLEARAFQFRDERA